MPVRALWHIPVTVGGVIQRNVFPTILFTEGYKVMRQNFGFSKDKLINNFFLGGMIACTVSKFYVNPWFDEQHIAIDAVWLKMGDKTISHEEYYAEFYTAVWAFTKALSVFVSMEIFNQIFQSLVSEIITFNKQREFIDKWLSNDVAYGINVSKILSKKGVNNEKEAVDEEIHNLHPVKLFADIEKQNSILSLWNTRISTIIDCITACYSMLYISPSIVVPLYFGSIILPKLVVLCIGYSLIFNMLLILFEAPARAAFRKMNELQDSIIRQITNVDSHAESISFLGGEAFEGKKLLELLNKEFRHSIKYSVFDSVKQYIVNYMKNFEWLFPILATIESVRNGEMKQEMVGPCMHHNSRINSALTWAKDNFEKLHMIEESVRRLALYEERMQAWKVKCAIIQKKIVESKGKVSFSGKIFADDQHKTILAQGDFTLVSGSISHFKAPSGSGKTTLFRIFRRIWGEFKGQCTLPKKEDIIFLPSKVYILGIDESLFQTICYPVKNKEMEQYKELVKKWMRELELPERICDNLGQLFLNDENDNQEKIKRKFFNWVLSLSDGEAKRVAFCLVLLKLHTQKVKFLVMDEPFKGINAAIQQTMVNLFKRVRSKLNSQCTVLFSSHEAHNYGLNTHVLEIDKKTKEYQYKKHEVYDQKRQELERQAKALGFKLVSIN
ncbi:hypothetical protein AYO37_00480 [Opitutia bacterium SCGC AG-212-L18]|nr:hypothetical protein AYO37_00480 [Opitutae bacterium SCGC AG-212-L18]